MNFCMIPIQLIPVLWDEIAPLLLSPVEKSNGEATLESVYDRAMDGVSSIHLLTLDNEILAAFTLEVMTFESGLKSLAVPLIGGRALIKNGDEFMAYMRRIARQLGCDNLRGMSARSGWLRTISKYGWKTAHEIVICEIGDEE